MKLLEINVAILFFWNVLLTAGVLLLWNRYLKQHEKIVNLKHDLKESNSKLNNHSTKINLVDRSITSLTSTCSDLSKQYNDNWRKQNNMYIKIFRELNKKVPRRPMTAEDLDFEMKEDEPDEIKEKNVNPVISPMGPMPKEPVLEVTIKGPVGNGPVEDGPLKEK